ncbi:MAG: hypothetical protein IKH49_01210 [Bacteroidales bacterium]|nr:hypothetical protein [Bacteroidales bacterium]
MMKFGIIGDPVSHSKSPVLFRAAYGGAWPYELIEGSDFETSWKKFLEEYTGINVTAPFKALAFRKADIATVATARIGAANLIVKTPQGTEAHNSDFSGVILSVREALAPGCAPASDEAVLGEVRDLLPNLYPTRPEALVIGCGGAGRAAAVAAAEMGFRVRVMNRTYLKAVDLCREMPEMDFEAVPVDRLRESVRRADLVLYTATGPLQGLMDLSEEDYSGQDPYGRPSKLVLEANYKDPSFTGGILETLENAGAQYVSGRRWLLYQAVSGYRIFTGREPDMNAMISALI